MERSPDRLCQTDQPVDVVLLSAGHGSEFIGDVRDFRPLGDELGPMQKISIRPTVDVQCRRETFVKELSEDEPDALNRVQVVGARPIDDQAVVGGSRHDDAGLNQRTDDRPSSDLTDTPPSFERRVLVGTGQQDHRSVGDEELGFKGRPEREAGYSGAAVESRVERQGDRFRVEPHRTALAVEEDRQEWRQGRCHPNGSARHGIEVKAVDLPYPVDEVAIVATDGVDPRSIVNSCVELLRGRAKDGRLILEVDDESPVPLIVADKTRLKQILLILLSNAIKFTPPGGSVVIATYGAKEGGLAFEVRDDGPGMTGDEIKIALEPFGQADAGIAREREGTGLGLPLAQRLAELHGGSLHIESCKGFGVTVTVTLPAARVMPFVTEVTSGAIA